MVRPIITMLWAVPSIAISLFQSFIKSNFALFISWHEKSLTESHFHWFKFFICNETRIRNQLALKQTHNPLIQTGLKWLSVRLRIYWLWVRVPFLSLNFQISGLFRTRSFSTFRQLQSVDSILTPKWHDRNSQIFIVLWINLFNNITFNLSINCALNRSSNDMVNH